MTTRTGSTSSFREYLDENQSLPADCILGNIAWFGVEDGFYDATWIEQQFTVLGLNPDMLPARNNPINSFEKAVKVIDKVKYAGDQPDQCKELLVREASRSKEMVTMHVIREVKDASQKVLSYGKVGEVIFYKPTYRGKKTVPGSERVRTRVEPGLPQAEHDLLTDLFGKFDTQYVAFRDYVDGPKVRQIIRDYLGYLNAVMMKPSVYFVHNSRGPELASLQTFTRSITSVPSPVDGSVSSCTMALLPLADLKVLREEVVEAFQQEAEKELAEVVKEIAHVRSTRKTISPSAYANIKSQYEQVMRKASEYGRTLRISQDKTAGAAEFALESLLALEADMRKAMGA